MNEKSNGYIYARQLKEKLENILNITLSESSFQKYRHNIIGTNFRRCRFAPKIFTKEEKVNRLKFCLNFKRSLNENPNYLSQIVSIDESKFRTLRLNFMHNRLPSSRPKVAGIKPRACKSLNVFAGLTTSGTTLPIVK